MRGEKLGLHMPGQCLQIIFQAVRVISRPVGILHLWEAIRRIMKEGNAVVGTGNEVGKDVREFQCGVSVIAGTFKSRTYHDYQCSCLIELLAGC